MRYKVVRKEGTTMEEYINEDRDKDGFINAPDELTFVESKQDNKNNENFKSIDAILLHRQIKQEIKQKTKNYFQNELIPKIKNACMKNEKEIKVRGKPYLISVIQEEAEKSNFKCFLYRPYYSPGIHELIINWEERPEDNIRLDLIMWSIFVIVSILVFSTFLLYKIFTI